MGRKYRVFIANLPFLVLLESIDGLTLYKEKEDYNYFLYLIKELSKKYLFDIHAYVLLENSVYFLGTPKGAESLVKFMQSIARAYSTYYNKKYNRKGTIWASRYKASLIEERLYLLDAMVFVESKPENASFYPYSSIGKNLLNKKNDFIVEHRIYKELGDTENERVHNYSAVFNNRLNSISQFDFIQKSLEKQLVIGSLSFVKKIEEAIGKTLRAKKRGRPRKNQKKDEKMYSKLTVLDKEKHAELKLKEMQDLNFAKDLSFCPVTAKEAELVAQLFPVVFTGGENSFLIALLSLGNGNLAINKEGKWISNYIPLFLRKYPFALGKADGGESNQKVILIDENSNLFSTTEGHSLFTEEKEATEVLKNAIKFLTVYDNDMALTNSIIKDINDSGILVEREITVQEGDEKKVLVKGFKVVDREKLNSLSDEKLADWARRGIIYFIEIHLKSLNNIENLFKLMTQKEQQ